MQWTAMLLLGSYHGINPGMGWLFAVALGMQEGSARGVWRALPPIALGHALAVASVVAAAMAAQAVMPLAALRLVVAGSLVALGLYRLWRHRHPRFGGMRVGFRDLTFWSFLMASAHGAGFMALPFLLPLQPPVMALGGEHAGHVMAAATGAPLMNALAVGVHSLAYLLIMAVVAYVVYRKLGLALLRTGWFNLDWLWAGSLLVTGLIVLVQ
jgi:hypothetical protein